MTYIQKDLAATKGSNMPTAFVTEENYCQELTTMILTNLLTLFLAIATVAIAFVMLAKPYRLYRIAVVLVSVALFASTNSLPALAAPNIAALGASEEPLSEEQKQQEEKGLKLEPGGGQYKGLESVREPGSGKPLSDAEIENRIKEMRGDLVANVANGSVILSGRVENIEIAREVVKQVKGIPGVKQITFELGLENEVS